MSHLDHVIRVKNKLSELGVTCPFKQRDLIDQAYVDSIIATHFVVNPTFSLTDKERDCFRTCIDRWNAVSPIGYKEIYNKVMSSINLMYSALRTSGRYETPCIIPNTETPDICLDDQQEYKDLVAYLQQEVKNAHE